MKKAAEEYFAECEGQVLTNEDGDPVLDKHGSPVIVKAHPPTVTGLALWLGFKSRRELLNYRSSSENMNAVLSAAISRCEEYAERRLYDRDGVSGAKFTLTNNFKGWNSKTDGGSGGEKVKIVDDI